MSIKFLVLGGGGGILGFGGGKCRFYFYGCEDFLRFGRERTTLNPKARKSVPVFWPRFFPCTPGLFPVAQDFLCIIPTEQVLYYRNLGLYYGLASGTLPLYSDPCFLVRDGCVACDRCL